MKVTNEKTEGSQAFLTIEMEPAEVEESLAKSYQRLVKRTRVPGFRRGKTPRLILERYLGREGLLEEALKELLPQAYRQAIKEQGIEAIAQPQVEVTQTEPLVFKAIVPLKPKVKLGDYHHIEITSEPVTVSESDVNEAMEELRHQRATWEPVTRPVDSGDLVVLDVESDVEGRSLINQKGAQYQVMSNRPSPVPGFAEQLIGMKKDEEKEFKLHFPADYPRGELAGKEAKFKVMVAEIKQEILPELKDEFAQEISPDFKTLDALRERVLADLKLGAEEKASIDFEERIMEAIVNLSEVEFPPVLVEAEISQLLNEHLRRSNQGLEAYLSTVNKTEAELREELRPLAVKRVTRSLVLGQVTEAEKIEVSDAEIASEIENMTKSATENKDKLVEVLNTPQVRQSIKDTLLVRKTIQRLVEVAKSAQEIKIN